MTDANDVQNIAIGGYLVLDDNGQPMEIIEEEMKLKWIIVEDGSVTEMANHDEAESTYEVFVEQGFVKEEPNEEFDNEREDTNFITSEDVIEQFEPLKKEDSVDEYEHNSNIDNFIVIKKEVEQLDENSIDNNLHEDFVVEEVLDEEVDHVIFKDETFEQPSDWTSEEKFICDACHTCFDDMDSAKDHDCFVNEETPNAQAIQGINTSACYECNFCKSRLKTVGGLQRHQLNCRMKPPLRDEGQNEEYKCSVCLKLFHTLKSLCTHKRTHERLLNQNIPRHIVCDICSTAFTSEKNLKLHRKIHDKKPIKSIQEALPAGAEAEYNELNKFFCEICNKSFDQNLLVVHKNMHQNVEEFNCGICNRKFENLPSYEMHMQLHADKTYENRIRPRQGRIGAKLPFPCNYCGREFSRPHEKVKHERIHTGEKPYECEVCGKTFRVSYSLTLHLRTHTDIRPYVCATCNKRFKSQPVYAHHLNTHLSERPYKCNLCSKSFRTSVQLCGHKNSHTKPFNCVECNRPFATLYAVKIHMKTHNTGNKSSDNLKHRCVVCGAIYARLFALRFHMKEQHSIDLDSVHQSMQFDGDNIDEPSSFNENDEDSAQIIAAAVAATDGKINDEIMKRNNFGTGSTSTPSVGEEQEVIVDGFHTEEVITDWLIK